MVFQVEIGAGDKRIFLADICAGFIDNREAVGVGILGETDIGVCFFHGVAKRHKIFSGWFRRMSE